MPPVTGRLSPDLAELLSQKIREMEQSCAAENDRSSKAQKGRSKAAVKTKQKETKKLVADTEITNEEKIRMLLERLESENETAVTLYSEAEGRMQEIGELERERVCSQAELNRVSTVKNKLDSLCRQLQQQSDALLEERKRKTESERRQRHDLADQYQKTIEGVKKQMDQQADERTRLAQENEDLRKRFKTFFEQYDVREKELKEQQGHREQEIIELNKKLEAKSVFYKTEINREAIAQREYDELSNAETVLQGQLQTYTSKFGNFQEALSKSNKVLGQYRRQKNKMERKVELLEKENRDMIGKNEKKTAMLVKERDAMLKEKLDLQEKCKSLQGERQRLRDECEKAGV